LAAALLTALAGLVLPALLLAGFVLSALLTGFILTLLRVALLMLTVALIVLVVCHRDVLRYSRVATDGLETVAQKR
jgi:membrane protein implicated in regulation of membrane protease activity